MEACVWKDVKETFLIFVSFFCGIVKLICELWRTFFINLRLRQKLNLRPSALFYKNLSSAKGKFAHSAVCGNTYVPPKELLLTLHLTFAFNVLASPKDFGPLFFSVYINNLLLLVKLCYVCSSIAGNNTLHNCVPTFSPIFVI